jgi:ABC-type transporter Mla maintaining outer membrane lipid asymmetry ATPase subunit MlaF
MVVTEREKGQAFAFGERKTRLFKHFGGRYFLITHDLRWTDRVHEIQNGQLSFTAPFGAINASQQQAIQRNLESEQKLPAFWKR